MKGNTLKFPISTLLLLSLIPWPGPTIFKISCPRDNARVVRKIVQTKWIPILDKYKVELPLECPFHPMRDIFGPQQAAKKQHRPSQWTCGICGKSFFEEKFLDMHFDNRHKGYINMAEDAVCLADYCDIMRCDVLNSHEFQSISSDYENTDIEIWHETSHSTAKALVSTGPRDVAKYSSRRGNYKARNGGRNNAESKVRCQKTDAPEAANIKDGSSSNDSEKSQQNTSTKNSNVCPGDLVDSALPASNSRQQRFSHLQKLKANCKPEELQKIKTKCEILVRDCIASLLIQLSVKDFKEVEDEFNRAVCWYLTCDRYWEDSASDLRSFPWGLACMIVMVLSLGACLCYYIIWVIFDTDDMSVASTSFTDRSTPSPAHVLRQDMVGVDGHPVYTEDYIGPEKDNDYIYVTYPPDLKRRLLERYFVEPDIIFQRLKAEIDLWIISNEETSPDSTIEFLFNKCDKNKEFFPLTYKLFLLLLTLPASVASCERSFSALKRLKAWTRSNMAQERLSGLALMHINRNLVIDIEKL